MRIVGVMKFCLHSAYFLENLLVLKLLKFGILGGITCFFAACFVLINSLENSLDILRDSLNFLCQRNIGFVVAQFCQPLVMIMFIHHS